MPHRKTKEKVFLSFTSAQLEYQRETGRREIYQVLCTFWIPSYDRTKVPVKSNEMCSFSFTKRNKTMIVKGSGMTSLYQCLELLVVASCVPGRHVVQFPLSATIAACWVQSQMGHLGSIEDTDPFCRHQAPWAVGLSSRLVSHAWDFIPTEYQPPFPSPSSPANHSLLLQVSLF